MTTEPQHGNVQLFLGADWCGHVQPAEPKSADADWTAWEEWADDHPASAGPGGDLICLETPDGVGCEACTEEADLPEGEYVACQLAGTPAAGEGEG